jgi:hypothetical protein
MTMKKLLLYSTAGLLLIACTAQPSRAQFNGIVALQTVAATVANATTCTGSAQTFSTTSPALNTLGFKNIGQTSHLATATSNAATFQMEIDGVDNLGNVFRLSDLQIGVPTSAKGGLVVTASGYMTNIQINVTCSAGATFSISYSGSFSPQPPNVAGALLVAVDKLPFQTAAANATSSTTFQTPGGNSGGTIVFQYSAAGPAGSTVGVQCISNNTNNLAAFQFAVATPSTPQLFNVPPSGCPFVSVTYTSGGASAVTYTLEYVFTSTGNNNQVDPCAAQGVFKSVATFTGSGTNIGNLMVTAAGTTQIYVCSYAVQVSGAASPTVVLEYGTGGTCTSPTLVTGQYAGAAAPGVYITSPATTGSLAVVPPGKNLCFFSGGTTTQLASVINYVQQ